MLVILLLGCRVPIASWVRAEAIPSDSYFPLQWNLHNTGQTIENMPGLIGADIDWLPAIGVHSGTSLVTVAIVADGIDAHEDFVERLLPGWSIGRDPFDWRSSRGQGTRLAGVVGATADNAIGIAGIVPRAQLLPVRTTVDTPATPESTAKGIVWAVDHGADVVLVASALVFDRAVLEDAIAYAALHDVLVVAPVGDDATAEPRYPARYHGCLGVTATNHRDEPASFANVGSWTDVTAPGVQVWSTDARDQYRTASGTAVAAAHVAGVAALVRSFNPSLSADEVTGLLLASADDLGEPGRDNLFGAGRVNARGALDAAPKPSLRFDHPVGLPSRGVPFGGAPIFVELTGTASPASVVLVATTADGANFVDPLVRRSETLFAAWLPPAACDTAFEFYLVALTADGHVLIDPPDAPARSYSVRNATITPVFVDTFDTNLGWEVLPAGGANSSGQWTRVVPVGTSVQPSFDVTPNEGRGCYVTGQYLGGSEGLTDVDGGPFQLVSPIIDLTTDDAIVSYTRWFVSKTGTPDELVVEVSRDGGAEWSVVEIVTGTDGWAPHTFRLSEHPELAGSRLRVRFTVSDLPNDSLTEAAVDEFRIEAIRCDAPPGDADGDGVVTSADYAVFAKCLTGPNRYVASAGCLVFDATEDGRIDLADVSALLGSISAP